MNTFIKVESSNIAGLSYDKTKNEVATLFNSGSITIYKEVNVIEFNELLKSPSIGSHLHRHFKGNYAYVNIGVTTKMDVVDIYKQSEKDTKQNINDRPIMILTDMDYKRGYATVPCVDDMHVYSGKVSIPDGEIGIQYKAGECPHKDVECNTCKSTGVRMVNL